MTRLLIRLITLLFLPLWHLQLLVWRNPRVWVFGEWFGDGYHDNSRALYEYVCDTAPDIRPIWISRNPRIVSSLRGLGREAFGVWDLRSIYFSLIAKVVVINAGKHDVNNYFINGALIVQLWHSSLLKKIGLDDTRRNPPWRMWIQKHFFPFNYAYSIDRLISASPFFNAQLSSAFGIASSCIRVTGLPRNDWLLDESRDILAERIDHAFPGSTKIVYLPTFRDSDPAFDYFDERFGFDGNELTRYLEESNSVFIFKNHYASRVSLSGRLDSGRVFDISEETVVLNQLIKSCDVLITDYSGVMFDFLILRRPVILAPFDFSDYTSGSRELYFDYEEIAPGGIVRSWNELIEALARLDLKARVDREEHGHFNQYRDTENSMRVEEFIRRSVT